jgi:HAD superfamily hydrolase (TIGR01509 family)
MTPALLFDLDGTLVSTDHLHYEAFREMLAGYGRAFSHEEFATKVHGRPNTLIFADYFPDRSASEQQALAEAKEARVRAMIDAGGALEPTRGLIALLDWADKHGVRCAVVTNAPPPNAETMLRASGLAARLPEVVSGEALPHGKPHPLPYLEGARRLGADPARVVAFEDSVAGLTSAVRAGFPVAGIAATEVLAKPLVRAGAALIAADFTNRKLLQLVSTELRLPMDGLGRRDEGR